MDEKLEVQTRAAPKTGSKKSSEPKAATMDLKDSFKFGIFAIRAIIAAITGKVYGNTQVDAALGDAIGSIQNPQDLADESRFNAIAMNAAAGAWKAVEGDDEWE